MITPSKVCLTVSQRIESSHIDNLNAYMEYFSTGYIVVEDSVLGDLTSKAEGEVVPK